MVRSHADAAARGRAARRLTGRCVLPNAVYSFGVVCWELLTSRCPYESLNQIQVGCCVSVALGWVCSSNPLLRFRFRAQVAMAVLNEGKRLAIPDSTPSGAWHA